MTSMIDVVFLLLIFFLVTTSFIQPEKQLNTNIVFNQSNSGLSENDLEPTILNIFNSQGRIYFQLGGLKSTRLTEFEKALSSFPNQDDGGFIRVGQRVPFENCAKAIALFKSCGFEIVSYLPEDE